MGVAGHVLKLRSRPCTNLGKSSSGSQLWSSIPVQTTCTQIYKFLVPWKVLAIGTVVDSLLIYFKLSHLKLLQES